MIDYRDVTIHRNSLITLKNVSLKVKQGEFVYIIGKVGSGKSSLLKSLYADVPVASGSAHVLDYDLRSIRSRDIPYLRRQIGIVFQDFRLLTDRSAEDNLRTSVCSPTVVPRTIFALCSRLPAGATRRRWTNVSRKCSKV